MSTSNMSNKKIKSHRINSRANKKIEMEEFRVKNYKNYFLTSESVTKGHPDKVADLISDCILDEYLKEDKNSRVAVETLISNNKVTVAGQVSSNTKVDIEKLVRNTLKNVEYNNSEVTMDYKTCDVEVNLTEQSKDIALGVDDGGAGDQGIIFGYATDETEEYMPYPISLAHKLSRKIDEVRENKILPYLKSDGKVQVTVEYINDTPIRVDTILISVQHSKDVNIIQLQKDILEEVILETVDPEMLDIETKFYINPTGRFVIGGAKADTGLTGRKIIVDTYGGIARHGGGAFSGKDATKKRIERIKELGNLKFEEKSFNGGKIVHNKEINRIQFLFASIPNEDIRKLLKANGFHWSKKEQAWQREFNQNCIRATERIEKKIKELEKQEDEELE